MTLDLVIGFLDFGSKVLSSYSFHVIRYVWVPTNCQESNSRMHSGMDVHPIQEEKYLKIV